MKDKLKTGSLRSLAEEKAENCFVIVKKKEKEKRAVQATEKKQMGQAGRMGIRL